jgi:hypothetical protein
MISSLLKQFPEYELRRNTASIQYTYPAHLTLCLMAAMARSRIVNLPSPLNALPHGSQKTALNLCELKNNTQQNRKLTQPTERSASR